MKLICPNCGEFVPGPDIDLRRSLGVCRPCGEVVPLPAVVVRAPDGTLRFEGSAAFTAREITRSGRRPAATSSFGSRCIGASPRSSRALA